MRSEGRHGKGPALGAGEGSGTGVVVVTGGELQYGGAGAVAWPAHASVRDRVACKSNVGHLASRLRAIPVVLPVVRVGEVPSLAPSCQWR